MGCIATRGPAHRRHHDRRGMRLFTDGRTQEAIDQFTKAIALDPSFPEAWERRAEAYSKQGRGEAADADRLILSGLDATSSPG